LIIFGSYDIDCIFFNKTINVQLKGRVFIYIYKKNNFFMILFLVIHDTHWVVGFSKSWYFLYEFFFFLKLYEKILTNYLSEKYKSNLLGFRIVGDGAHC
jgi:hypothetical protein